MGAIAAVFLETAWIASNFVGDDDPAPAPIDTIVTTPPVDVTTATTPAVTTPATGTPRLSCELAEHSSPSWRSRACSLPVAGATIRPRHPRAARRSRAPTSQTREFDAAPPMCLDDGVTYHAIVTTNQGELTIASTPRRRRSP